MPNYIEKKMKQIGNRLHALLMPESFARMQQIEQRKYELEQYRLRSEEEHKRRMRELEARATFLAVAAVQRNQDNLNEAYTKIRSVPEGQALLNFLEEKKIPVRFHPPGIKDATCRAIHSFKDGKWTIENIEILLPHGRDADYLTGRLLHEIQHARILVSDQFHPDKKLSDLDFCSWLAVNEADAQANAVIILLKISLAGDNGPFDTMMNERYNKLFRIPRDKPCNVAYLEYYRDPSSLNDGRLKRKVFDAWFEDEWMASNYHQSSIQDFARYNQFFDEAIPCTALDAKDIEMLGTVSADTTNYLTMPGFKPLDASPYIIKERLSMQSHNPMYKALGFKF